MQMWDSMPRRMISVVLEGDDTPPLSAGGGEGGGRQYGVREGSHMLNRVLSTWALHKGWDKKGLSSATVGPRRVAF